MVKQRRQRSKRLSPEEAAARQREIYERKPGKVINSTTLYHKNLTVGSLLHSRVIDYLDALNRFYWSRYELRAYKNDLQMLLDPILTKEFKKKDGTTNKPQLSQSNYWTFKLKNKRWVDNIEQENPEREYIVAADFECYDTPDEDFTEDYVDKLLSMRPGKKSEQLDLSSFDISDINEPKKEDPPDPPEDPPSKKDPPSKEPGGSPGGSSEGRSEGTDEGTDEDNEDEEKEEETTEGMLPAYYTEETKKAYLKHYRRLPNMAARKQFFQEGDDKGSLNEDEKRLFFQELKGGKNREQRNLYEVLDNEHQGLVWDLLKDKSGLTEPEPE